MRRCSMWTGLALLLLAAVAAQAAAAQQPTAEQDTVFWESIRDSSALEEFEAYLGDPAQEAARRASGAQPRGDVRRQGRRRGVLAGDRRTARVLHLESRPPARIERVLERGVR